MFTDRVKEFKVSISKEKCRSLIGPDCGNQWLYEDVYWDVIIFQQSSHEVLQIEFPEIDISNVLLHCKNQCLIDYQGVVIACQTKLLEDPE